MCVYLCVSVCMYECVCMCECVCMAVYVCVSECVVCYTRHVWRLEDGWVVEFFSPSTTRPGDGTQAVSRCLYLLSPLSSSVQCSQCYAVPPAPRVASYALSLSETSKDIHNTDDFVRDP